MGTFCQRILYILFAFFTVILVLATMELVAYDMHAYEMHTYEMHA